MKICDYHATCNGCRDWQSSNADILLNKLDQVRSGLLSVKIQSPQIECVSISDRGLRDRMDFTLEQGRIGLYHAEEKRIQDLPECLQLSQALAAFYALFRKINWPVQKGSFRLRSAPEQKGSNPKYGAWLDFSNLDVKNLLSDSENSPLSQLKEKAIVEVGQKRKILNFDSNGKLKLQDPEFHIWSQSLYLGQDIGLYSVIGGFSQVGHRINHEIVQRVEQWTHEIRPLQILEYGSGSGNLTFPALGYAEGIKVLETDPLALAGLEKTAREIGVWTKIVMLDSLQTPKADMVLMNPPRSGALELVQNLEQTKAEHLIYMSCFFDSFLRDSQLIQKQGYRLEKLTLVDQFPRTSHFELLSKWKKA